MPQQPLTPVRIASAPGCQRDGTLLYGPALTDNQWSRPQLRKGLPRKMGGYRRMSNELYGISRGLNIFNSGSTTYTHSGWSNGLQRFTLDMNGNVAGVADRTPATFTASANNLWQFSSLYNAVGTTTMLLATAAPNLLDISANTEMPVYYGDILGSAVLTATGSPSVSGGVFVLGPFAVSYGNFGIVNVSAANDVITGGWTQYRPTSAKLLFGLPVRAGAGNGPSGLIWGVEALLRMTFVGGTTQFNFDEITTQYSILSSQAVVEYDGIYYWPGIDHFLMFNGVIQEVENGMNQNWFYDNLNYTYAQKVFAMKVPRWGEIWFCYPRGTATECTHAVILNVRLSRIVGYNVWYDTELPNGGRSAAQYARVFRRPIMTGVDLDATSLGYKLWEHEFQTDEIDGTAVRAIESYFETNVMCPALPEQGTGTNRSIYWDYIEPDFVQTGDMTMQILGSPSNARAPEYAGPILPFPDTATSKDDQLLYTTVELRQTRFRFSSNVVGGDYQMGECIGQARPGDNDMVVS